MTRKEEIEIKAKIRANQYSHPIEWNDCYHHWIEGAEWADENPDEKMIVKYLYEKKGYPIDLNGNLPSFDETMKDTEKYLKYKQDKFIEKAEKYLQEHLIDYWSQGITDESGFIEEFKTHMKG